MTDTEPAAPRAARWLRALLGLRCVRSSVRSSQHTADGRRAVESLLPREGRGVASTRRVRRVSSRTQQDLHARVLENGEVPSLRGMRRLRRVDVRQRDQRTDRDTALEFTRTEAGIQDGDRRAWQLPTEGSWSDQKVGDWVRRLVSGPWYLDGATATGAAECVVDLLGYVGRPARVAIVRRRLGHSGDIVLIEVSPVDAAPGREAHYGRFAGTRRGDQPGSAP